MYNQWVMTSSLDSIALLESHSFTRELWGVRRRSRAGGGGNSNRNVQLSQTQARGEAQARARERMAEAALEALRPAGARPGRREAGPAPGAACPSRAALPAGCRPSPPPLRARRAVPVQTAEQPQVRSEPGAVPPPATPYSWAPRPADSTSCGPRGEALGLLLAHAALKHSTPAPGRDREGVPATGSSPEHTLRSRRRVSLRPEKC